MKAASAQVENCCVYVKPKNKFNSFLLGPMLVFMLNPKMYATNSIISRIVYRPLCVVS